MLTKTRILLADDHRIVREGIKTAVEQLANSEVAAECDNAAQLEESAKSIQPDLVVLDISMPESRCADTIRFLRRECPRTKILVLTMHNEMAYLNLCLEAGASGYILKTSCQADLLQAVKTVLKGGVYIDPELARKMAHHMRKTQSAANNVTKSLSEREAEVLRLVARGETNKSVAALVGISEKSVETYKSRALEKLDLRNRSSLLRYALAQGWLDDL